MSEKIHFRTLTYLVYNLLKISIQWQVCLCEIRINKTNRLTKHKDCMIKEIVLKAVWKPF